MQDQAKGNLMLVQRNGANRYVIAEYRKGGGWRWFLGRPKPFYGVTTGFRKGLSTLAKDLSTSTRR